MSEKEPQFPSHIDPDPELREKLIADIKAGKDVWIPFSFTSRSDMDEGIRLEFYTRGENAGYIDGDDRHGYDVYGLPVKEGEPSVHLNMEPVGLQSEAQRMLEKYVKETSI